MNNQSPLIPQGSLLEQRNQGRARVKIAVFVVLAIHGIGLLALLMQGCKKEPEPLLGSDDTNAVSAPAFAEPTNAPPPFAEPAPETNVPPPVVAPVVPPVPTTPVTTEYKIVRGDTYSGIAKRFQTTTRALMDANPGVDPTKLQIGQTLQIPPPAPTNTLTAAPAAGGEQIYTVKSGDTLIGIAKKFGTTEKAIRTANNLTTTRIKVGQPLKIPAKAPAPAPAPDPAAPTGATPQ